MSDLGTANCGCGCEGRDRLAETVDVVDVTADADAATTGCGFGSNSCLWIILLFCRCGGFGNGCGRGNNGNVAMTAACGSSFFSAAVVVSATDAVTDAVMDADAIEQKHSCIGLKRRSYFSVSFSYRLITLIWEESLWPENLQNQ